VIEGRWSWTVPGSPGPFVRRRRTLRTLGRSRYWLFTWDALGNYDWIAGPFRGKEEAWRAAEDVGGYGLRLLGAVPRLAWVQPGEWVLRAVR